MEAISASFEDQIIDKVDNENNTPIKITMFDMVASGYTYKGLFTVHYSKRYIEDRRVKFKEKIYKDVVSVRFGDNGKADLVLLGIDDTYTIQLHTKDITVEIFDISEVIS
jgi:hypothetical protein